MKKITVLLLISLGVFIQNGYAQQTSDNSQPYTQPAKRVFSKAELDLKIGKYAKLKKAGSIMSTAGGIIALVGIGVTVDAISNLNRISSHYDGSYNHFATNYIIGTMAGLIGIGLAAGGVTMETIGIRKMKKYQSQLNNVSFSPIFNLNAKGFSLRYRF